MSTIIIILSKHKSQRKVHNLGILFCCSRYCLSKVYRNNSDPNAGVVVGAVICYEAPSPSQMEVTGVLTLISVVFLLLTLGVYLYLPQMRFVTFVFFVN